MHSIISFKNINIWKWLYTLWKSCFHYLYKACLPYNGKSMTHFCRSWKDKSYNVHLF